MLKLPDSGFECCLGMMRIDSQNHFQISITGDFAGKENHRAAYAISKW